MLCRPSHRALFTSFEGEDAALRVPSQLSDVSSPLPAGS